MAFALSMGLLVNALKADERIAQLEARVPELEGEIDRLHEEQAGKDI
jgi:hypothetical protein